MGGGRNSSRTSSTRDLLSAPSGLARSGAPRLAAPAADRRQPNSCCGEEPGLWVIERCHHSAYREPMLIHDQADRHRKRDSGATIFIHSARLSARD